ncbi:hypothetical protein [Sulfurovum sp. NBC37-1]|uniref:hypothetical protein n=1 Tax=Sulfurovum sp. (strain NBC37-1) TaxID=387093 RepID=UPI00015878AD|nr:hypothetical protein [Sulfurovum sp. NBC37-1]BAF71700.1 hypothetical protein SUN_0741 [Sulfurovum sp. NBC37-1]
MKTFILLLILTVSVFANEHLEKGEKLLYSFKTQKGKTVTIAVGANDSYMVYRYGKEGKIEFEYPKNRKNSFGKFTFSSYFRGGGAQNEGLDLNALSFTNKSYKYTIFDEYSAADESRDIGIRITKKGKKITTIKGVVKTIKGSLSSLENYPVKTTSESGE